MEHSALVAVTFLVGLLHTQVQGTYITYPCSVYNLDHNQLHLAHPTDPTKYIQCDQWGKAYERQCPAGEIWQGASQTCIDKNAGYAGSSGGQVTGSSRAHHNGGRRSGHVTAAGSAHQEPHNGGKNKEHDAGSRMNYRYVSRDKKHDDGHKSSGVNHDYPPPVNFYGYEFGKRGGHMINLLRWAADGNSRKSTHQSMSDQSDDNTKSYAVYKSGSENRKSNMNYNAHSYKATTSHQNGGGGPCAHARNGHVMAHSDMHKYYECQNGNQAEHDCQAGNVWVQPLRLCVNLESSKKEDRLVHNPCVDSNVRYHPYPQDPTKYMECTSWDRVYIWSCGQYMMWAQQLQACIDLSDLINIGQQDANDNTDMTNDDDADDYADDDDTNPCDHSELFYHPYKKDESKYIQCDQFGNMYIRNCGPRKVWDEFYNTCVGDNDKVPIYDTDYDDDYYGDYNEYDGDYDIDDGGNSNEVSTACDDGLVYDEVLEKCVILEYEQPNCPADHVWSPYMLMCITVDFGNSADGINNYARSGRVERSSAFYARNPTFYEHPPRVPGFIGSDRPQLDENPCGKEESRFYFPYAKDKRWFIQCDQMGNPHMQACSFGEVWNQETTTCVAASSLGMDTAGTDGLPGYDIEPANPCTEEGPMYFKHPTKEYMYIMCVGSVLNMMSCPDGSHWNEDIQTCYWPATE